MNLKPVGLLRRTERPGRELTAKGPGLVIFGGACLLAIGWLGSALHSAEPAAREGASASAHPQTCADQVCVEPVCAGPVCTDPLCADSVCAGPVESPHVLRLKLRSRTHGPGKDAAWQIQEQVRDWNPTETAFILCDVWNEHWCRGATQRCDAIARKIGPLVDHARQQGVHIVHCPSGVIDYYRDTPQRQRTLAIEKVDSPVPLQGWCHLNEEKEGKLPIDDSDGGCDCTPQCKTGSPWKRQHPAISIQGSDVITDDGQEVYSYLRQQGVKNLLFMGVHTNMCVLGRSFGIRQMTSLGFNTALVRDLTDTMYNHRMRPFVPHEQGTDLVIEHVEKYWCPTTTSEDLAVLVSADATPEPVSDKPHIVFVLAEDEYQAAQSVPTFAREELDKRHGFRCTFVTSDDKGSIPGLEQLADADLAVFYIRRRTLPAAQLQAVREYLNRGKPLVALRTTSHAFQNWLEFDPLVLGGHYSGHYGNKDAVGRTRVSIVAQQAGHPILRGIDAQDLPVRAWLYKAGPLNADTTLLMTGRAGPDGNVEPVAWTNDFRGSRVFYTSLGHPDDFQQEPFRQMLRNAVLWGLERSEEEPAR